MSEIHPTVDDAGQCSQCHQFSCDCATIFNLEAEIETLMAERDDLAGQVTRLTEEIRRLRAPVRIVGGTPGPFNDETLE